MKLFPLIKGSEKPPEKKKWPTARFAESGSEAADSIAAARRKKNRKS